MTPDTLQQPAVRALIQQTADVLGAPLDDAAIEYKIPDEMMRSLREDVFVFSGFKTYHQLKEASELLLDEQGRVKSFNKFYQDVSGIREKYNRNWLHAEYNFAVSSSQMAAKWAEQSADADICDLTYSTAGDDKVRPDHAVLDGVTLPVEDPFWSYAYPPNGWNCRCNVIRSLKDITDHALHDPLVLKWIASTDFSKLFECKYIGWGECELNAQGVQKHPEASYFTYYEMTVGGEKRYLYAKMHIKYGKEVPYCILFDKPEKIETSAPPKKK